MRDVDKDRLISASEVERWSYCPMSWYLWRERAPQDERPLARGRSAHGNIAREAERIMGYRSRRGDVTRTTWAYIVFAGALLASGFLLAFLSSAGIVTNFTWSLIIVILSLILVGIAVEIYFSKIIGRRPLLIDRQGFSEMRGRSGYGPYILYLIGAALLVNSVLLLRPLGIDYKIVASALTFFLIVLYAFMLILLFLTLRSKSRGGMGKKKGFTNLFWILLVLFLSILLLVSSYKIDPEGYMGHILLILSLVWFLGALLYEVISKRGELSLKKIKDPHKKSDELPIVSLAMLGSVFAASAFLSNEAHLRDYSYITIIIALVWLLGALAFIIRAHNLQVKERAGKENLRIAEEAEIHFADDAGDKTRGRPMISGRHFLIGTPDLMLEENGQMIPVEVKSGSPPERPHFSHRMQIGAYMILTDETYGQITPYGYLEYLGTGDRPKMFRVERSQKLKAEALSRVSMIRNAMRTGEVHRDHRRPGKCRGCSRRKNCPERIV